MSWFMYRQKTSVEKSEFFLTSEHPYYMFPMGYLFPHRRIQLPSLDCEFHVWYYPGFTCGGNVENQVRE